MDHTVSRDHYVEVRSLGGGQSISRTYADFLGSLRHQNHLPREPLADGGLDNSVAILIPSFKLRQDDSILAEHKVTGKAIYSKRATRRAVAIVDLAPIHSVAVDELLPLLLCVILINANNDNFFRVDAGGHRFQQW